MKSPIGQRTLLSLAVAASLACISGGNVLADGSITYCVDGVCNEYDHTEQEGQFKDNLVLYDPDSSEGWPVILTDISEAKELVLNIEGTSESNFEDITGTVYGIATASHDITSNANLTINITNAEIDGSGVNSHVSGTAVDAVLYGVYAASPEGSESGPTVKFGNVTINIVNSILGSANTTVEGDTGVEYFVIGARASGSASLEVGDVKITVNDAVLGEEYSRVVGVKYNSSGTLKAGDIYIEIDGDAQGGHVEGYSQSNFEKIHPTSTAEIGSVTVKVVGSDPEDSIFYGFGYGCNLTYMGSSTTIDGDIVVEASNITLIPTDTSTNEAGFVGLHVKNGTNQLKEGYEDVDIYNTVVTVNGSVSVTVDNAYDPNAGGIRAVEKFDAGTVTITGNVSTAARMAMTDAHSIGSVSVGAGTLNITGATSLYVEDVESPNIYAFRAGHESSYANVGTTVTMDTLDLVHISNGTTYELDGVETTYQIKNNIYGLATETNAANGGDVSIKTGAITVTLAGEAEHMAFLSVYGTVIGDVTAQTGVTPAGTVTVNTGLRTLVFGYEGKNIEGEESTVTFDSTADNSFYATFSNFDSVEVKDGSTLYIDSSQNDTFHVDYNQSTDCGTFFSSAGHEADDGGSLWSRGGVLYLRDGTSLVVDEGGTADILTIVNYGTITVTGTGTLTTYGSTSKELDEYAELGGTFASTNEGTIEGTGTLVIAAVDGDDTAFTNSGTVTVTTGEISGSYDNQGTTTFTNLTLAGTITNSSSNSSFEVSDTATVGEDDSASITNTAGSVAISTLDVEGALTFDGAITATDTTVSGTLSGSTGSTLTVGTSLSNSGTVALYAIDASGVTYTQTSSADVPLTIEDGWFTGSTLNIQSGTLNPSDFAGANGSLGDNTVNISGTGSVTTDTVTAETTVNIQSGGTFTVATIDLSDATTATITLDGGTLVTTADQFFSDTLTEEVILLDSDETGELTSTILATYYVGDVLDSIKTGVAITSGALVFTDDYYASMTQGAKDSLTAAGYDISSLELNFEGTFMGEGDFTVSLANEVIGEGDTAKSPGVILNTVTLVNDSGSTSLYVGGSTGSSNTILSPGMGFMDVSDTEKVFVTEGTFVLVGKVGGDYTSDQLLLDASTGGDVQVLSGATFSLGTQGATSSSGGLIGTTEVSTGGAFNVKNGEFAVWSIENDGTITIDSNGILHTASLTPSGTAGTESTSKVVNNGTLIFETFGTIEEPALTVDGTFENNGTLTADEVDTVTVSGTLQNAGTLTTNNISVSGTAENTSSWTTSGTMTLSGTVTNSGEMSANVLNTESGSSVTNSAGGTLTVDGGSSIGGTLTNAGTFTANGTLTVSSTVTNNGSDAVMTINSLNAEQTALINNEKGSLVLEDSSTIAGILSNRDSIGTADVEITGTATNQADAAWTTMGTVTVSGGTLNNYGDMSADTLTISSSGSKVVTTDNLTVSGTLTIDAGSLDIQSGTFTAGSAALNGGTVTLGSSSAVSVELGDSSADIGSQVSVLNGSRLSIGSSDYGLDWADSETGSSLGNLVVVSTPITTTETGGISVGAESTGAGLYFSSDSTLVVSVDSLNGSAAFITTAGTTATVESGATLVLGGSFTKGDSYTILQGYTADIADNAWGYTTDNEDYLYGEDNNGLKWSFHLVSEDGTVYVQAVAHEDVAESLGEDLADPDIVNDAFDHCSSDPGSSLICGILTNDDLSKEDQQKTLNSVTEIAFAGGVMATTMTDVTAAVDSVHNHLTMDGDAFGKDGNLWPWDKSSNLWIDVLGSWQHGKHLNATSISNYKYRTNSYGFILGYDYKLPDRPVVIGGAFSFSDGDLKSKGGVSKTKNDYQTYGVSLYGNYSPSSYYNIIGSVHWFHNSADIKQYTSSGKATAKVQTNLIAVGLRGETTLKAGQVNFVPHAEARYIYGKSGKYTTKLDGAGLWNTKADGTHTVQFPVGVAARTDIKTNSGWNIRPKADVSVIPQVGSTRQKSTVRAFDGVSDTIEGQFMGKFGASVKLGVQADKSNATVGVRYGFLGGTKGRADHSVMLQGRLRF